MTYQELLKTLANYCGYWDDEVVFVAYQDSFKTDEDGHRIYKVTSVGTADNKCRLNNIYDDNL